MPERKPTAKASFKKEAAKRAPGGQATRPKARAARPAAQGSKPIDGTVDGTVRRKKATVKKAAAKKSPPQRAEAQKPGAKKTIRKKVPAKQTTQKKVAKKRASVEAVAANQPARRKTAVKKKVAKKAGSGRASRALNDAARDMKKRRPKATRAAAAIPAGQPGRKKKAQKKQVQKKKVLRRKVARKVQSPKKRRPEKQRPEKQRLSLAGLFASAVLGIGGAFAILKLPPPAQSEAPAARQTAEANPASPRRHARAEAEAEELLAVEEASPKAEEPPKVEEPMTAQERLDRDILARTLYGEADAQNENDAIAIACTIINRTKFPSRWPGTIAEVCQADSQFSCWNENDHNLPRILAAEGAWFERCQEIALEAVKGRLPDVTFRATHYYSTSIPKPFWAKNKVEVCEVQHRNGRQHKFYNNIDTRPPPASYRGGPS